MIDLDQLRAQALKEGKAIVCSSMRYGFEDRDYDYTVTGDPDTFMEKQKVKHLSNLDFFIWIAYDYRPSTLESKTYKKFLRSVGNPV